MAAATGSMAVTVPKRGPKAGLLSSLLANYLTGFVELRAGWEHSVHRFVSRRPRQSFPSRRSCWMSCRSPAVTGCLVSRRWSRYWATFTFKVLSPP